MQSPRIRAAELAAMLAAQVPTLAAELLPSGHREGGHWRCGGVDGSPGQSLAIHLHGPRAGVWHDFATGEAGDALDLIAVVLFRGDTRAAMEWARRWLGGEAGDLPRPPPRPVAQQHAAADQEARRRKALALFLAGQERLAGTPVAAYLEGRGIKLAELGRQPRALRFHPECWNSERRAPMAAMLAAITDGRGTHLATHRTWLAQNGDALWRKASLVEPKKTLGPYAGGFIPLWRGASRKPLSQVPKGETVAIAEGIETALSVALACPELRVLSAVALGNLARIALPDVVTCVILCADNDEMNPKAQALLERAAARFVTEGREVRIARPPSGKDFNDTLREEPAA